MHPRRMLISLALLMSYSVGITHNMVPHCLAIEAENHIAQDGIAHHHHTHHAHDVLTHTSPDHIEHKGHCDRNIYDFLICLLSELEHPANNCDALQCVLQGPLKRSVKPQVSKFFAATCPSIQNWPLTVGYSVAGKSPDTIFESHNYTIYTPLRGPPVTSC